ncbi:hypothetical protein OAA60_03065 [Porticoccaceae bacterium]|nr:hypothetical protein [Porticoccaceae bacterium]
MTSLTATNKETGEKMQLVAGEWVPMPQSAQGQSGPMSFIRAMSGKLAENVGNIPAAVGGSIVDAAMNPNPFAQKRGPAPGVSYGDAVSQMAPSSDQIFADVQRGAETASKIANYSREPISTRQEALANQQGITRQNQANHPFLTAAGDVAGDVGTLMTFRAPMAKNRAALDYAQANGVRTLNSMQSAANTPAAQSFKELFLKGFSNSPLAASLTRGTTKAGEAAVDGMMLGIMNRKDPVEAAAIGAGSQVGASMLMSTLTGFKGAGSPATRLMIAAGGTVAALQTLRVLTPLDAGSPVTDLQMAFPKIIGAAAIGMAAGVMGGRVTGTKAYEGARDLMPVIADQFSTALRGISLERLTEWMADPRIETTLSALARDPDTFGAAAGRRIERAITNGNMNLSNTIDELSRNKKFRQQLESLNP